MNLKIRSFGSALLTYIIFGFVIYPATSSETNEDLSGITRELQQFVSDAKKEGKQGQLIQIINALGKRNSKFASEELLPDYISFLNDNNGEVQWLGARGLHVIKNPKSTKVLIEYLKSKDLQALEKKLKNSKSTNDHERYRMAMEFYACTEAVIALGETGDKSAIPVLESLQGIQYLGYEMVSNPVEEALVQLGSVNSLLNIPPDTEERKIMNASSAVSTIRDPNKVPDLTATLQNPKIADSIRSAAMAALTEINPPDIAKLFVKIMSDPNYNQSLRRSAAIKAGKTKDKAIEAKLLEHVQDANSFIRPYAFVGLVLCMPEKYTDLYFDKIMDTNEEQEFRKKLVGVFYLYSSRNLLKNYREGLYNCLNAADKDGRPVDAIRISIWRLINDLYKEEPQVTLTSRDSKVTASIQGIIRRRVRSQYNHSVDFEELQKRVNEEIRRIVKVYDE